jgi:acetolactate synthase-1/2/3 large subunit
MEENRISGAQAMLHSFEKEGVTTIFGYPGGTIMPLYDKLYDFGDKIRHILVRHEQGAVHAAQGYARATGKVGVCIATAGPGATNLVTGIADAMMDSTPIVCITAQVGFDNLGNNFFQEADTISITIPVTKWSYQITQASEVASVMAKAFYIAQNGRPGPVLISFTKNAQTELTVFEYNHYKSSAAKSQFPEETIGCDIDQAIKLINRSNKPLIIAGQGVLLSGACDQLMALSVNGNIPVVTTLLGISTIPTGYPLYCGFAGMHGTVTANRAIQQCDLLIAVGMRFSDRVTGEVSGFAPSAKIIHIDIDKAEFNKCVQSNINLLGDAGIIMTMIISRIEYQHHKEWLELLDKIRKGEQNKIDTAYMNNDANNGMANAVATVARYAGNNRIIVTDVGQHQMFCARFSEFDTPRTFITSGGLGTMGFGLPAAIGAKLGKPGSEVVLFCGDGGFQMSIQELGTIMSNNIDIKIVILNNSYLGMVRQWQELFFDNRYSFTKLDNPDFVEIAHAYEIPASRADSQQSLEKNLKKMFNRKGPYLLEVLVGQKENIFPMVPAGATLDKMIIK